MLNSGLRSIVQASFLAGLLAVHVAAQEHNKLTTDETNAGYDLLFNGVDLSNWHAYRASQVTDAWTVKTNAPLGPRIENGNGNKQPILTNKKYMNFDLKIDVQTTAGGNSGIFVRYEETATQSGNARSGPEFQVCGPNHSDCIGATKHFGSCYDMFGVKEAVRNNWYNPPGSWNQIRIVAFDSNYVHYGNGKKLLEYKIGTPDFIRAYNESKYVSDGNNGRYYHIHPGGILLQHHGEIGITFRNIKAKELTTHPFKQEFKDGKWPENLPQDFVFGNPTIGIAAKDAPDANGIKVERSGPGLALVKVPFNHSDFQAIGLDGRTLAHERHTDGSYRLRTRDSAPGIAVVRVKAAGSTLSRVIGFH